MIGAWNAPSLFESVSSDYVMRRHVTNVLVLISLILCVAAVVDRVAQRLNCHWVEVLGWRTDASERVTRGVSLSSWHGVVITTYYAFANEVSTPPPERHLNYGTMPAMSWKMGDTLLARAGFGIDVFKAVNGPKTTALWIVRRSVEAPNWFLATIFGVAPLLWLVKRRVRRRRATLGLCPTCGYDLRATSDRCPECGAMSQRPEMIAPPAS